MAYNYGAPGASNGYGLPPGMGPPPNMGMPPGMDGAPGLPSPAGQAQFQPPPNMPNINFNAPVIRLGMQDQPKPGNALDRLAGGGRNDNFRGSNAEPLGRRDRPGLGADRGDRNIERDRAAVRESMMALQPPTREELARTIFVGGLGEGAPDDMAIEAILRSAGKLRRWTRARDADDKVCKFGFAEYEDVDSLEAANEIFVDVEVPVFSAGKVVKDEETEEVKKMKLLVVVDEQSKKYIEEWAGKRREDESTRQFRIDGCREDMRQTIASIANHGAFLANGETGDGDIVMANGQNGDAGEIVNIPVPQEDELSDIPADLRATVAEEIKAFRERSTKRDLEKLKREEELEQAEKQRSGMRVSRLASPPPSSAPLGPGGSNGVPVGPRGTVQGAPAGPRGYRGAQLPSDYVNGVSFVAANGANGFSLNREDEDDPASDEELERRRQQKKDDELQQEYERAENRWRRREHTRAAAQERERHREMGEERRKQRQKEDAMKLLRDWDDEIEARKGMHEYYLDHSSWQRRRAAMREIEMKQDAFDRDDEARERGEERRRVDDARGRADEFMEGLGEELAASSRAAGPVASGVKISLGSAAAKRNAATAAAASSAPGKRAAQDVEGLLEDEEDAAASGQRRNKPELKPLPATSMALDMTDEERNAARRALASEIPTDEEELFAYPLNYKYLTKSVIEEQIRPLVERKIVDILGMQEDDIVELVVGGLEGRKSAREIVGDVEEMLDEEATMLVRKVWRMAVFVSESSARGFG